MRDPIFRTRITELLGIRHPLLCGGLGPGVSDGRYVAAAVNAGGMGFIVTHGPDFGWTRDEIRKCRDLVDGKGFGVNLYFSRFGDSAKRIADFIPFLADNGVTCVETAGASPEAVIPALKEAGIKVIHKIPAVRYLASAQRSGADAVIVVGADCGGHPGIYQISTMVQAVDAARRASLPIVVGGGIGTGEQVVAALAMGAEAVVMGSRMMVADELWIHDDYKNFVATADGTQSVVVKKLLRDHHRVLDNDSAKAILAIEAQGITDFEAYRPHASGEVTRESYRTGDHTKGMFDFGPASVFADRVAPVEAIFDQMLDEAVSAMNRLEGLRLQTVAG